MNGRTMFMNFEVLRVRLLFGLLRFSLRLRPGRWLHALSTRWIPGGKEASDDKRSKRGVYRWCYADDALCVAQSDSSSIVMWAAIANSSTRESPSRRARRKTRGSPLRRARRKIRNSFIQKIVLWFENRIPVDWIVRRFVRWLAFSASSKQIQDMMYICQGALPIAKSAMLGAEIRETCKRAIEDETCTPEVEQQATELSETLRASVEDALASMFAVVDSNDDGKVTIAEALSFWAAESNKSVQQVSNTTRDTKTTVVALLDAMKRAKTTVTDLERAKRSIDLAVEGAIAAVDADGDGQISLEEAVQAPQRVGAWLGVWRDMLERGKL